MIVIDMERTRFQKKRTTVWYEESEDEDSLVDKSVGLDVGDHVPSRPLAWVPLLRDDDPQFLGLVENFYRYSTLCSHNDCKWNDSLFNQNEMLCQIYL